MKGKCLRKQLLTIITPRFGLAWWLILLALLWASYSHAQGCAESALHQEFYQDSTQRQYVACSTDQDLSNPTTTSDVCVQEKLNAPCTDNSACKVDQTVTREAIWAAIDATELETLYRSTAANDVARKGQLESMSTGTTFDMGKAAVRQKWTNVFTGPASPISNAAILALQQKNVSRCEVTCKKGNSCTLSDVSLGLRGVQ